MAALGCPSNMATVVSAVEPMQEYVQVVVGADGDPSQVVVVQGGGGELLRPVQELSQEILQSISQNDTVFYVQPDGSLLAGGSLEDVQSGVRLVTAGGLETESQAVEAAHPGLTLVTSGQMEDIAQPGPSIVPGGDVEAIQPGGRLETGGQVESEVHGLEAIQAAVNLVTRGQAVEAGPSGMILVAGGHIEETVHPVVSQVHESQVQLGMDLESAHPDMVTALNLTKEAAPCTDGGQPQEITAPEVSLAPEIVTRGPIQVIPEPGATTNSGPPTFTSPGPMRKDAAQQLKTVAHHVALSEGDSVTRILNQKQLKSIHYQVPGVQTKKSADPVVLNLSTVHMKNSASNLLGSPVVQIKNLRESGQPLVVNSSSLESPIQILVRSTQLSAAKPKTDPNKNTMGSLEEHRSCVAHPQNGDHTQKKGHKRKKSIKIKTRSGRISRPPKHKAKDYKFLKVGDMIQGSTSDSEDYSELSTEEDEKGSKQNARCDPAPHTVKNALFQCQTCEKSYMGKGGLSRHYRLYPSHGQMETPFVSDAKKNGESGVCGHSLPSETKKPTPRPRKRLLEDPLNPDASSLPNLVRDGLEFVPVSTTCRGRRQMTGRRFGRPRKLLAIGSSEQNALTATEMIQQCEAADIKEYVAPCFSERLSVYDFMLVKVKQEHPDKPLFPHLYKELETLHAAVRILAQEYLSTGQALQVTDCKVAASLGISAEKMVEASPPSTKEKMQVVDESKSLEDDLMPPSKRLKLDELETISSSEDVTLANVPEVRKEELTMDFASMDGGSSCEKEEEAEKVHITSNPESIPCEMDASVLGMSSPEFGVSTQISDQHPGETDAIQTQVIQEDTEAEEVFLESHNDQPSPHASANGLILPSDLTTTIAEKPQNESFQGVVDTLISADIIASDQCTQPFTFHHGQELVFVDSSEETTMAEAVVVYDGMEPPANTQLDNIVALMERK
ncbi:zinc finger protein 839 [Engystomops pustulosus]|uniref:zinc finger protein 839 n=1 Tax=Engystomops pustulosus TaxID=76066 RepID=UPI003AFAB4B0